MSVSVTKTRENFTTSMEKKDSSKVEECEEMIFFRKCSEEAVAEDPKVLKRARMCSTPLK